MKAAPPHANLALVRGWGNQSDRVCMGLTGTCPPPFFRENVFMMFQLFPRVAKWDSAKELRFE